MLRKLGQGLLALPPLSGPLPREPAGWWAAQAQSKQKQSLVPLLPGNQVPQDFIGSALLPYSHDSCSVPPKTLACNHGNEQRSLLLVVRVLA